MVQQTEPVEDRQTHTTFFKEQADVIVGCLRKSEVGRVDDEQAETPGLGLQLLSTGGISPLPQKAFTLLLRPSVDSVSPTQDNHP